MLYFAKMQSKAIKFWRKNSKKILVGLVVFLIIFIINNILKNMPEKIPEPSTTYTPHVSVMTEEEVPEKYSREVVSIIDRYFNYCNNADYENAYNCITQECKDAYYPNLESFTGYVKEVFEGKKKIYNIQSYSIVDNKYIYSVRILDDILANGTTDGYYYYEEKFVLTEINGQMKLSIGEFISQSDPNIRVEDEYMIVEIVDKVVDYETETYKVVITNKSDDKYIVIADGSQNNEIALNVESWDEKPMNNNQYVIIKPGGFTVQEFSFEKFYDNGKVATALKFGAVRILNEYDYAERTTQEVLNNAVKLYSAEIPL